MSDDRKLESLKSLQLEIKSKLNLLATKKAYEDEKNRHIQELSWVLQDIHASILQQRLHRISRIPDLLLPISHPIILWTVSRPVLMRQERRLMMLVSWWMVHIPARSSLIRFLSLKQKE